MQEAGTAPDGDGNSNPDAPGETTLTKNQLKKLAKGKVGMRV
jgi:hypothetical protein